MALSAQHVIIVINFTSGTTVRVILVARYRTNAVFFL